MKKIVIGVAVALVSLFLILAIMIALSSTDGGASGGVAVADGVLTVGVPEDLTPYGIHWDETEIAQLVGDILAVPVELVPLLDENGLPATRAARLEALNSGKVDLILAQVGYDSTFDSNYLTSISYGSGGLYLANPLGTYLDTLAVMDGESLYVSDSIPSQVMVEVPSMTNVVQYPQEDRLSTLSQMSLGIAAGSEQYFLFTEEEAMSNSLGDNMMIRYMPLLNSPHMDYVGVANKGEGALISACNQAINEYLDALTATVGESELESDEEG